MPSSQDPQPAGQDWHEGPKKPVAQDSQEDPLKPVGQTHCPEAEQTPELEQGGEHELDCMSRSESEGAPGSWPTSGTESQRTMRLLEPVDTETHTFDERASALAGRGTALDEFEAGVLGS